MSKIAKLVKRAAKDTVDLAKGVDKVNRSITKELGLEHKEMQLEKKIGKQPKNHLLNQATKGAHGTSVVLGSNKTQSPIILKKREFIRNINGNLTQDIAFEPISVLNTNLFPWGSQILPQYEMYRIRKCRFTFQTTSTDYNATSALGIVALVVAYDPDDPIIGDIPSLLNYNGAKSRKISQSFSVDVVTANNPLPIRYVEHNAGANAFNDYGLLYVAVAGNPSVLVIGELWVDYEIEVFVPRINTSPSFQHFWGTITSAGAATNYLNDVYLTSFTKYGQNYMQPYLSNPTPTVTSFMFTGPGFYFINVKFWCNTASTAGGAVVTTNNIDLIGLPSGMFPGNYGTPPNWNSATPTMSIVVGGNSTVSQWYYIDAVTKYRPLPDVTTASRITFSFFFTTSASATFNAEVIVMKTPFLSNNTTPYLPTMVLEEKIKAQDKRINSLMKVVHADRTFLDDNAYAKPLDDKLNDNNNVDSKTPSHKKKKVWTEDSE